MWRVLFGINSGTGPGVGLGGVFNPAWFDRHISSSGSAFPRLLQCLLPSTLSSSFLSLLGTDARPSPGFPVAPGEGFELPLCRDSAAHG